MRKNVMEMSKKDARKMAMGAQGFYNNFEKPINVIRKLGYLQIDTISVAERTHHHVLHTRYSDYQKERLQQMMKDKLIFEYWSHAAAFLPIEDYHFSLYMKNQIRKNDKFWFDKDKKVMRYVMKRIGDEGPLQSKDFQDTRNERGNWYEWKPAKIALGHLFMEGKIMVRERQGFQKIFDLPERVLPDNVNTKIPSQTEFCKYLIEKAVDAHGLVSEKEIGYLRKGIKPTIKKVLKQMIAKKEIIELEVEGCAEMFYSTEENINGISTLKKNLELHFLSPFDNLIIQRKRTLQLFDFDYQLECYLPAHKRKYGYFTLPILFGQKLVGRLDPKADRKNVIFYVKSLWFEDDFIPDELFIDSFSKKIKDFATFCDCKHVIIEKVTPSKFKRLFKSI